MKRMIKLPLFFLILIVEILRKVKVFSRLNCEHLKFGFRQTRITFLLISLKKIKRCFDENSTEIIKLNSLKVTIVEKGADEYY